MISLAILLPVVNHQATQIFLNTKNEQMDREFAAVLELAQGSINSPSLLAYWEAFPEETETLMTDEEQKAIQDHDTMWSFISQSEETVLFSSLGDAEKRYAAHILYMSLSEGLSYIMHLEGYDRVALVDIREENLGRIICSDAVEGAGEQRTLTDRAALDLAGRSVAQRLRESDTGTVYDLVTGEDGTQWYIGLKPLTITEKPEFAVAVFHRFSTFRRDLDRQLTVMGIRAAAVFLLAVCGLQLWLNRQVVRPVSLLQKTVRKYAETKEAEGVVRSLSVIRSQNELGALSRDFSALAEEMDRYYRENIQYVPRSGSASKRKWIWRPGFRLPTCRRSSRPSRTERNSIFSRP